MPLLDFELELTLEGLQNLRDNSDYQNFLSDLVECDETVEHIDEDDEEQNGYRNQYFDNLTVVQECLRNLLDYTHDAFIVEVVEWHLFAPKIAQCIKFFVSLKTSPTIIPSVELVQKTYLLEITLGSLKRHIDNLVQIRRDLEQLSTDIVTNFLNTSEEQR